MNLKASTALVLATLIVSAAQHSQAIVGREMAQALGYHCSTQQGVCQIPPAILGSICSCGDAQGVVVP
ncbi:hypothetical protein [Sinorhizobium sp. BG8]|uniref:hypothetical protein n=1 Tax=Sinorhizobium sp. BG8 TaxID=2613773 RepID=UPI00193D1A8C|nr:hypothetical protein [Sinorhizobium sp. BG8]QRM55736.1 hypothetical protein F3Y30_15275 [Sinorhizobium sp. BG8]